jgi:hypothetical protein
MDSCADFSKNIKLPLHGSGSVGSVKHPAKKEKQQGKPGSYRKDWPSALFM